jgi:hypothetical protein
MGRSLGSASVIEIAYHHQDQIKGLIIESGFADVIRLLAHIGVPLKMLRLDQPKASFNIERIRFISIPTLIIHGECDNLIPVQDGKELYQNSGAEDKQLLVIPEADHNNIFLVGWIAVVVLEAATWTCSALYPSALYPEAPCSMVKRGSPRRTSTAICRAAT